MDEVDLETLVREPKFVVEPLHRQVNDLTPEEHRLLDNAHQLRITTHTMLRNCDDPKIIPTLKRLYFDACKQYSKTYTRLGL